MAKIIPFFISYSTKDKKLAGKLHAVLKELDIESFLAHEKKNVANDWRDKILKALDTCIIYIPLITGAFLKSSFAQQEAGYALCRKIKIFPLCFGKQSIPPGFLETYQGHKITAKRLTTDYIATLLLDIDSRLVLDYYINSLKDMPGFRNTESTIHTISPHFTRFTTKQARTFVEVCISNNQIWDAIECKKVLIPEFLKTNSSKIPINRLKALKRKIRID